MSVLFEYGNWVTTSQPESLRAFLRGIYDTRLPDQQVDALPEEAITDNRYQPFLQFDGTRIRARNFVGFVQNDEELIEIYPKVFREVVGIENRTALMLRHLFFWFDHCRKWKFPFTKASLDSIEIDSFPELIIHLIAQEFLETVSSEPLSTYEPVEEGLRTPRGSINFKRYLANGFATGNIHIVDCDHEPFAFNNRVNRIIKHCTRLLLGQTRLTENIRLLQETVFILDEVDDVSCTIHDVESSRLNPFFDRYKIVLEMCSSILAQQLYSANINDLTQWCLLFPMEYIFEDFVAGFLDRHFSNEWQVEYQKSDRYLTENPKAFMMQHDILLTHKFSGQKWIVDTKYKLRSSSFKSETKKGIDQSDLYQMTAYAFRRGCKNVLLLYPNLGESLYEPDNFTISSGFLDSEKIRVVAAEIPFWSVESFDTLSSTLDLSLNKLLNQSTMGLD